MVKIHLNITRKHDNNLKWTDQTQVAYRLRLCEIGLDESPDRGLQLQSPEHQSSDLLHYTYDHLCHSGFLASCESTLS